MMSQPQTWQAWRQSASKLILVLGLLMPSISHAAPLSGDHPSAVASSPSTAQPTSRSAEVREIDLTISHERKLTDEEKLAYEDLFKAFADNVYEMSNGAHKLRNLVVFDDGRFADRADIVFSTSTTRSNAIPNNYGKDKLSRSGMSIEDRLGSPPVAETALKSLAGTLAHEFGHYFYGALDEYIEQDRSLSPWNPGSPAGSDTPPEPCSLMSGCYSTFEGVNFSTKKSTEDVGKTETAHYRVYKASGWEAIARDPKDDPLTTRFNPQVGPEQVPSNRLYWPELADKAPPATEFRTVELPAAQTEARSALKITWADASVKDNRLRFFLVDVSKNMGDSERLNSAKTALKAYVDRASVNDQIGIITFADSDTEIQPLTKIVDESSKEAIKTAIEGITLSTVANQRVISGADQKAVTALAAASTFGLIADRAVYVIINGAFTEAGPGGGFAGTGFEKVSATHGNAGIPISIFNFNDCSQPGDFWPGCSAKRGSSMNVLQGVVRATRNKPGEYKYIGQGPFEVPLQHAVNAAAIQADNTNADALLDSLQDGDQELSPRLDVNLGTVRDLPVQVGQPFTATIYVDGTLDQIEASFFFNAAPEAAQLSFIDPNGEATSSAPTCESDGSESFCQVTISEPLTGTWTVQAEAISQTVTLAYEAVGVALNGTTYQAALTSPAGDFVTYPDPVVLVASLSKINPIAGAGVTAWVEDPSGAFSDVALKDDGTLPDLYPADGLYSGLLPYSQSGDYQVTVLFDNIADKAFYTTAGLADGDEVTSTVGADFDRFASTAIFVGGVVADDHGGSGAAATSLPGDNGEAYGRLDSASDIDTFHVVSLTVASDLTQASAAGGLYMVRFGSLTPGLDPKIRVTTSSGSQEYTPGPLHYSQYFSTTVDLSASQSVTVEISQHSAQSPRGNYAVSFGEPRDGELSTTPQTLTVTKAGNGSGTVTSSPAGINCGATCSASFTPNTVVTLTATPAATMVFSGWSGACTNTTGSCQVTMATARTVTATFGTPSSGGDQHKIYLATVQK